MGKPQVYKGSLDDFVKEVNGTIATLVRAGANNEPATKAMADAVHEVGEVLLRHVETLGDAVEVSDTPPAAVGIAIFILNSMWAQLSTLIANSPEGTAILARTLSFYINAMSQATVENFNDAKREINEIMDREDDGFPEPIGRA